MMMLKCKNTNLSFYDGELENERACELYECNPQGESLIQIAEAAYCRAERGYSGYQVPLEAWLQAEKEIDVLSDSMDNLHPGKP